LRPLLVEHLEPALLQPRLDLGAHDALAGAGAGHWLVRSGSSKPTSTVSGCRVTPCVRSTRAITSRITARTSSAEPPGSAWMKLACLVETSAVPTRRPLHPDASTSRPAESPGGFVN